MKQDGTYTIDGDQLTVTLEAWSEPSTYTFSVDGSSLTMNENLIQRKRNNESKMAHVCTPVFCRDCVLFSGDQQICASLKDIGREL